MGLQEKIIYQSHTKMFFFGVLVACGIYYSQGSKSASDPQIVAVKKDIQNFQEKLQQTSEKTANKPKFQDEVESVSQTFKLALEYLPKEIDIQDLLRKVYSEARNAGVQLSHFKPKESLSKDFYEELPMEIELKGSYSQIVLFLSYVSKLPRIINIRNVEMTDPTFIDNVPSMKLKGVLLAYRYKEGK